LDAIVSKKCITHLQALNMEAATTHANNGILSDTVSCMLIVVENEGRH
jgi:hypothetical protein